MEEGRVVPVFKKEAPLEKSNYRPITVLTVVDKIFEQLLSKQMSKFFEPILDPFVSAYCGLYSCESTLVRLVEDWKQAIDTGKTAGVLSTDMSKAFDTMHPTLLLAKLQTYGFSNESLTLMRSFFMDRKGRTKLGAVVSDWKPINMGCPQGSNLGPLLWNIYQNDLVYLDRSSGLSMYSDDHQLYYAHSNIHVLMEGIKYEGERMSAWYKENHLVGNLNKYQAMIIGSKHKPSQLTLDINGHLIDITEGLKLLGVIVDKDLHFSEHISATCKKASRLIGVLMRLRKLIPTEAKLQIYKTAILPQLTYCSLVWHFCKASDRKKLERVNERGLRAVFCNWNLSYNNLLKRANLTSLYNMRLQDIAIFMFKVKHKLLSMNILDLFSETSSNYHLRNSDFYILRFNSVRHGKHSLTFFGPRLWSKLSPGDRERDRR